MVCFIRATSRYVNLLLLILPWIVSIIWIYIVCIVYDKIHRNLYFKYIMMFLLLSFFSRTTTILSFCGNKYSLHSFHRKRQFIHIWMCQMKNSSIHYLHTIDVVIVRKRLILQIIIFTCIKYDQTVNEEKKETHWLLYLFVCRVFE